MKECEIRHDFIPDTEFAVRVFEHAEVLDAAQRLGDAVNRRCVEFTAVCMTETEQVLHIHRRRHVEFDLESLGIVAVVLTARPAFHIDFLKACIAFHPFRTLMVTLIIAQHRAERERKLHFKRRNATIMREQEAQYGLQTI